MIDERRDANGRDRPSRRGDFRLRPRRGHRGARGLHAPHSLRGRPRDHPPGQAGSHPGPHDPRRHLRPDDRRGVRAAACLLVGRESRRGLAAPVPRRGGERLAGAVGAGRAQPRGDGEPVRRWSVRAAVRRPAWLRGHRSRRADADHQADHVPVHRRVPRCRCRDESGRHDRPRPARRQERQRATVGHHGHPEGSGARRGARPRDGGGSGGRTHRRAGRGGAPDLGPHGGVRGAGRCAPVLCSGLLKP
jgi:hypothetical protein